MPFAIEYTSECPVIDPSLERAARLVPQEYLPVWEWFQKNEGRTIPKLPHNGGIDETFAIPISAYRGIHTPSERHFKRPFAAGRKYTLSIHAGSMIYADKPKIDRPDGTWTLDYMAHKTTPGKNQKWSLNEPLMNCMEDAVPVGVFVKKDKKSSAYDVLGLAYVESYNPLLDCFTLHGPVTAENEHKGTFSQVSALQISHAELSKLEALKKLASEEGDERARHYAEQVVRQGQERFRDEVIRAYDGKCAISAVGLEEVLQAAHIDAYRGPSSQLTTNGILLRADLHLLYDANLLAIEPGSHRIELAERADVEPYCAFVGQELVLPRDRAFWPDDGLLDLHYQQYQALQRAAA